MKKVISGFLALAMVLSVIVITPSIKASAALNDGDKLSVDLNLEVGHYTASTDTFTPLKAGETLDTGAIITVRICPKSDFLAGATRYDVMFSKDFFQTIGVGNAIFTPNYTNTFYSRVASGYACTPNIPQRGWPAAMVTSGDYNKYTAVAVGNQADSNSANGGHPDYLPGTWLFRFNLKVIKSITASSDARIWMDSRWIRNTSNTTADSYFAKCNSKDDLCSSGNSLLNFKIDLKHADIHLPITATPAAPALSASTKAITNKNVTVTITYPGGATGKQYKVSSTGTWKTYTSPVVLTKNNTVYAQYKNAAGTQSSIGKIIINNIDKVLPVITAKTAANNGYTKNSVTVTVSDTNLSSKTVTKNGTAITWPSSGVFSADGKYVITAKDKAGNVKTYTFTIDKTIPKITVKNLSGGILANNGSAKGGVTFSVTDTNLKTKSIKKNGSIITWPSTNKVTSVGTYVITAADKAGNTRTFTFKVT